MILIAGTIDVDPEQRDAALAEARPYIEGALTQEGCLAYTWTADPERPERIHVFEEWTSGEALEAHFGNRYYADMRRHLGRCGIRGAETHKYLVADKAPVYDSSGVATAAFPER
ncbi:MAG: putative quinol monooxygenase [Pseudomonadota bacterium]|nr:putative quinol monooxygenase [Pseudomonadota bacterium]